ncbi:MAG: methyltransferase domain-containing protein [Myxococcota bacterium]
MGWVRVRDLGIRVLPDGAFLVRAPARGIGARVSVHAVELLAFCSVRRTREEVARQYGPAGVKLFDGLAEAGFLVDPHVAEATPVLFQNFADVDVHRRMLADAPRMSAYARAIAKVVSPGMAVADAGTGSGVLAGMAAAREPRVVYAIDGSDMIETAREVLAPFGDRVRLVRGDVARVELPEKVDVIVSETFGALALAEDGLDDVRAFASRNLAAGGRTVPATVSLWLAPVGDPGLAEAALGPFRDQHGVDLSPLRATAMHRSMTTAVTPDQLLAPGACFSRLAFGVTPGRARGAVDFEVHGRVVGLCGWFDLDLCEGVRLGTGPGDPLTHWKQQLLPLDPFDADGPVHVEVELGPAPDDRRGSELRCVLHVEGRTYSTWHRVR